MAHTVNTEISIYPETLQISIPFELARYSVWQRKLVKQYETNKVIRAFDTWLVLKHVTSSGKIQQWNKQKNYLLSVCKCTDSVFRQRLKLLEQMQLITLYKIERKKDSIKVCSWDNLATVFEIDCKEKLSIQYNINDKQKIHQWLIAAEIQDNKNRQDFSIAKKLRVNAEAKMLLDAAIINIGADHTKLNDLQYYLMWLRLLYTSDFIRLSEAHNELIEIRPDNNRSVTGMANAWNCKSAVTVSYWKAVLKKVGILDISSLSVQSYERVRNNSCRVLWLKKEKQTLLRLCDQIEILKPWERTEEFKNLFAA